MIPRLVVITILSLAGLEYLRCRIDGTRFWKAVWVWVKYPLLSLSCVASVFFVVGIFATGYWPWDSRFFRAGG